MCVVLSPKAHLSETRSPSNATLADVKNVFPLVCREQNWYRVLDEEISGSCQLHFPTYASTG